MITLPYALRHNVLRPFKRSEQGSTTFCYCIIIRLVEVLTICWELVSAEISGIFRRKIWICHWSLILQPMVFQFTDPFFPRFFNAQKIGGIHWKKTFTGYLNSCPLRCWSFKSTTKSGVFNSKPSSTNSWNQQMLFVGNFPWICSQAGLTFICLLVVHYRTLKNSTHFNFCLSCSRQNWHLEAFAISTCTLGYSSFA